MDIRRLEFLTVIPFMANRHEGNHSTGLIFSFTDYEWKPDIICLSERVNVRIRYIKYRQYIHISIYTCPNWYCTIVVVIYFLSHVQLFVSLWAVTCQAPLSMGFPRQEYQSGLPFLPPWELADAGIEPTFPTWQVGSLPLSHLATSLLYCVIL